VAESRPTGPLSQARFSPTRRSLMSVSHYLPKILRGDRRRLQAPAPKPMRSRLAIEALEDRTLMSASSLFQQINLVSDQPGVAQLFDPNLVNPWGISESPNGGAFWLSDNRTGLSPLYFGDLGGSPLSNLFNVVIPGGRPTGTVFNPFQPIMSN